MKRLRLTVCRGPECGVTSADISATLRERIETLGLGSSVELDHFSCFGRCRSGPNVMLQELDDQPNQSPRPLGFGLAARTGGGRSTMYNHMTPDRAILLLHRCISGSSD